jgi:hypothetical protein
VLINASIISTTIQYQILLGRIAGVIGRTVE